MHKLFKPRTIRRIILLLSLAFPLFYLTGTLWFTLNGSNGVQTLAEPVYTEQYVQVDSINDDVVRADLDDEESKSGWLTNVFARSQYPNVYVSFNGEYGNLTYGVWSTSSRTLYFRLGSTYTLMATYSDSNITINYTGPWSFTGTNSQIRSVSYSYTGFDFYIYESVPTEYVPENNSAFSDYLFSKPFAKDNFITQIGIDVVDGNVNGFEPIAQLVQYVNENMLGYSDTDYTAMFVIGYAYYAINTLIVYEIVIIATKLLLLPLKAVDVFDRKGDYDD